MTSLRLRVLVKEIHNKISPSQAVILSIHENIFLADLPVTAPSRRGLDKEPSQGLGWRLGAVYIDMSVVENPIRSPLSPPSTSVDREEA